MSSSTENLDTQEKCINDDGWGESERKKEVALEVISASP
tara:strand:+ start:189 stop:305 length:117 start_codon:yes stop_codon:yes gene_type:complete